MDSVYLMSDLKRKCEKLNKLCQSIPLIVERLAIYDIDLNEWVTYYTMYLLIKKSNYTSTESKLQLAEALLNTNISDTMVASNHERLASLKSMIENDIISEQEQKLPSTYSSYY